jgi:hypothetical protein
MHQPRCGFPDAARTRSTSFTVQGSRWNTYSLTYRVNLWNRATNQPLALPGISNDQILGAVRSSFDRWTEVTPLYLDSRNDGADIEMGFDAIDGFGNTVGYAYFPDGGGDETFDVAEAWSTNPGPAQVDFESVALHEIGHSLGLDHSSDPTAVMYPSISGGTQRRGLAQDDIAGIQSIYGHRWDTLSGRLTSSPAVVSYGDGGLAVFARGTDNRIYWRYKPSGGAGWVDWMLVGNATVTSAPVAARAGDGHLEVFARGDAGDVRIFWQSAGAIAFTNESTLGGYIIGAPAVAPNGNGGIEVLARGGDNALFTRWKPGTWDSFVPDWVRLGGALDGNPVVGVDPDGGVEVFARGQSADLQHIWKQWVNGPWGSWVSHGGALTSDPAVGVNADGRMEVFARGTDGALFHIWKQWVNGPWTDWAPLGGFFYGNPAVGLNNLGQLEVFVHTVYGWIYQRWQDGVPEHGFWSDWESIGPSANATIDDFAVGRSTGGRLEMFARNLYVTDLELNWQR